MMVGRRVSFWDCLFLGAMLNFRGVDVSLVCCSVCSVGGCGGPSFDLQVFSTLEENHEEHVAPRFRVVFGAGNNEVRMPVVGTLCRPIWRSPLPKGGE